MNALLGGEVPEDLIRVVLADDHALVCTGVRAVLSSAKDIETIGKAKSSREAVSVVQRFSHRLGLLVNS
jgi:DNA-binding NarL/FixJ family response regulator